jgi:Flp pilus assembly protein TadG
MGIESVEKGEENAFASLTLRERGILALLTEGLSNADIAERLGLSELKGQYRDVFAIVPLKQPAEGMKVRIDGRTFVNYAQFEFGVAVPGYVAEDTGLPYKPFVPNDSMILTFT